MTSKQPTDKECAIELLWIARSMGYIITADGEELVVCPPPGKQVTATDKILLRDYKPALLEVLLSETDTISLSQKTARKEKQLAQEAIESKPMRNIAT